MELLTYLSSLSIPNLFSRMPAAAAQGIIWGIMALGVYITFRILDVADLTVDGSLATGGAVVTSQYIGRQEPKDAKNAAAQILFI